MSTYFSYTTITADVDPATEWVTVTSEALRTGRRGMPAEPTSSISLPAALVPPQIPSLPSATLASERLQRLELQDSKITAAPPYIQIRGLILLRQSHTDTLETIVTETTTITTTGESTIFSTSTVSDVEWTTSCDTRIAALNAKTTVTSTATLRLQPGETGLPYAEDDEDVVGSGAGNTVRRKYISSAARAGIGVDVALVIAGIAAIIGYFVKKRKNKKTATAAGAGAEIPMIIRNQSYNGPSQNPSGSPTTMFD